uniref:Small ribosomal subunit protein uS14c n=1 Tax=Cyanidium caldarium TaxID=2771 RepID=RR14_CYACA|nr:ribosomal protein S14 [Cyanidium caldarium]Q9TLQ7.1 RecName: Full=Small ribosomal subunit protein uS14c; AltName: Full=30S ribosomal protein S14, chloroplastic [Cyanidium caldarium]AAF12882.1 unknown [Cyanidium caldarium]WDB00144.1 ribosomal protein S14 [Cyanidium caldarium]
MAKKSVIQRNINRLKLINKYSAQREAIKNEIKRTSKVEKKISLYSNISRLPRDSSKVRLRSRCWVTGRGRSVYKNFGLSRHMFRFMASNGLLPGVVKSSW